MLHEEFSNFVSKVMDRCRCLLDTKSDDYSSQDDKLYNFKAAGRIADVFPIEALAGMDLKHRTSIQQGIEEYIASGILRPLDWWMEKVVDHINYQLLLLALIAEIENVHSTQTETPCPATIPES